jgi:hypothetical protein
MKKNQQLVVSKENLLILSPLGSIFEKVLPSNLFSAWISGTYHVDSKVFSTLKMCSVLEQGGMEWNGSVPRSWDDSNPMFGSEKTRNGIVPYCVRLEELGTEPTNQNGT